MKMTEPGEERISPYRPRRLAVVSIMVIAWGLFGIVVLAWPMPAAPSLDLDDPARSIEVADAYAGRILDSALAAAFDPHGHDKLAAERADAAARPRSPTSAFLLLDAARHHVDGTVFARWTAIFAFLLCAVAGAMGLWRAQRRGFAIPGSDGDPGPMVNLEAVGFAIAAMFVGALLVGWTAKVTSTVVTTYTGFACAGLMIAGRVMPRGLANPTTRSIHLARVVGGVALIVAGVIGRRTVMASPDSGAGEIVLRALPVLACTIALILGLVLAASNVAVAFLRVRTPRLPTARIADPRR
jgi:hypothetical protein